MRVGGVGCVWGKGCCRHAPLSLTPPVPSLCSVGYDVVATSAEEAINPGRNIPLAIVGTVLICGSLYMAVSTVIVLVVPYALINVNSPLSSAFAAHGVAWAQYIVSVGAVCGLSTSLLTGVFPMPRIIYALASDGLLPPWLARVSPRFGTPIAATLSAGLFAATLAMIVSFSWRREGVCECITEAAFSPPTSPHPLPSLTSLPSLK